MKIALAILSAIAIYRWVHWRTMCAAIIAYHVDRGDKQPKEEDLIKWSTWVWLKALHIKGSE